MLPPRPLLAACLVLLGLLGWSADQRGLPEASVADAARWEGQAAVVEGWAQEVRVDGAGALRLRLVDRGAALDVRLAAAEPPGAGGAAASAPFSTGDRLAVAGRLARLSAGLVLLPDGWEDVHVVAGAPAERPGWDAVARDPAAWAGRPLELEGTVEAGRLRGDGASLQAGDGPWPRSGRVAALVLLRYEPGCLCHVADAREVRPWTP